MDDLLGAGLVPLEGGWSGRTFLAEVGGERTVVRIYPDDRGHAPEVDAALLELVRGLLPVPRVLDVRRRTAEAPGLLVTEWLPGERGDLVLPRLDDEGLARAGAALGRLAADLAGMPMRAVGPFVDAELTIGSFGPVDGLPELVEAVGHELEGWSASELAGLGRVAVRAQTRLDTVTRRVLVHSDLNPKNVLLDPGTLEVTGLLDWEFAHAGHPFTDLGNLLRFDRRKDYADAVLASYADRHGGRARDLVDLARAADLWALVDLATRAGANPVAERADRLLREIARSGDLHAWPQEWANGERGARGWTAPPRHA